MTLQCPKCGGSGVAIQPADSSVPVPQELLRDLEWSVAQLRAQITRVLAGDSPHNGLAKTMARFALLEVEEIERVKRDLLAQHDTLIQIAKEATNGWACYAKRVIELDEIARLHAAIAKAEGR